MKWFLFWLGIWKKVHHPLLVRLLILLVLSFIATRVYWTGAFPYTHDGENHLARFANYFAAMREGQFPPRFAPHLFAGYGFPVFHYNYPLANIFAVPFIALKLNPEVVYALQALVATYVLGASWFFFLRKRFTEQASWVGVLSVLFSSVIQLNFFYRGNIGELWALALASLWFCLWDRREDKRLYTDSVLLSIVLACFLLSHNVLAVFLSPFLLLWQMITVQKRVDVQKVVLSWLLACGLVAWFWLPAVFELSFVVLSNDSLATEAARHTLNLGQIFFSPLRFGFSRPGQLDNLGWGWGVFVVVALWLGIGQLLRTPLSSWKSNWKRETREGAFFVALFFVGSVFSSTLTTFLWKSVPILPIMQFPWRWLSISLLAVPYVLALVFARSGNFGRKLLLIALCVWLCMMARLTPADRFHKEPLSYRVFPHTSLTRNENRPKTLTSESFVGWQPGPDILEGEVKDVRVLNWTGSTHTFVLTPVSDVVIQEKTVFFPGWETRMNGEKLEQVFLPQTNGLIAYRVPAQVDEVTIETSFTHRTPVRLISELLFISTLATIVGIMVLPYFHKKRRS